MEEYYEEPVYEEPVEYYEEEEKQPYVQPQEIYDPGQIPLDDEIEPTITDIDDEADMDEGTVFRAKPAKITPKRAVVSPRM